MFRKILIANRGEIAIRIMRAARELGVATVAVYSEADRDALHVRLADEAYLLGPPAPRASYLNTARVLEVAQRAGADAVHPGYGFFAENAAFAQAVIDAKLGWIGPHPRAISLMGDKLRAREAMVKAKVPVVPGGLAALADIAAVRAAAKEYGYPLALKAAGGGGGKGLKVAQNEGELESAFTTAVREADAYFGNATVYAERYLENPKHIELQVLADKCGTLVHVGERDCSLQRRHQKLLEEAPPAISSSVRERLREAGLRAAKAIDYDSVGTIEALVAGDEFFFLEMNTRIQVEHTVSEMISGLDLVQLQIRAAAGEKLNLTQSSIEFRGHAIEVRINAEDPAQGFRPAPGTLREYREPAGFGVRVDAAAFPGFTVTPDYDSLIAKLIVWGANREEARARLRRCLDEYHIVGVPTTIALLRALIDEPSFVSSEYGTATLERFAQTFAASAAPNAPAEPNAPGAASDEIRVEVNDRMYRVRLLDAGGAPVLNGTTHRSPAPKLARRRREASGAGNDIVAPMHGVCVEIRVVPGASVAEGDVVAVIEAMKMMNEIRAHRAGTVGRVAVNAGETVEARTPLMTLS